MSRPRPTQISTQLPGAVIIHRGEYLEDESSPDLTSNYLNEERILYLHRTPRAGLLDSVSGCVRRLYPDAIATVQWSESLYTIGRDLELMPVLRGALPPRHSRRIHAYNINVEFRHGGPSTHNLQGIMGAIRETAAEQYGMPCIGVYIAFFGREYPVAWWELPLLDTGIRLYALSWMERTDEPAPDSDEEEEDDDEDDSYIELARVVLNPGLGGSPVAYPRSRRFRF